MEMRTQILSSAQRLVQMRGFNGFSYGDIAKEVGIRKASVHHYFPTKTDLAIALVDQYTTMLADVLREIGASSRSPDIKLADYISIYRNALAVERACVGGMLASEALTLDQAIVPGLKRFFDLNIAWLTELLSEGKEKQVFTLNSSANKHARLVIASLQGALLLARALADPQMFEQSATTLMTNVLRKG